MIGCALLLLWLLAWIIGLRINLSGSMPRGLYRVTRSYTPKTGDIVAVCPPYVATILGRERGYISAGSCPGGGEPLLKIVAAVGGDTVTIGGRGVSINGVLLSESQCLSQDEAGRSLPSWQAKHYILPLKMLWLYAPSSRSWDSRYWGPVPENGVLGTAIPLIINN